MVSVRAADEAQCEAWRLISALTEKGRRREMSRRSEKSTLFARRERNSYHVVQSAMVTTATQLISVNSITETHHWREYDGLLILASSAYTFSL